MKSKIIFSLCIIFAATFITSDIVAQKRYSGSKHTTSHGGRYSSGRGSSHKGGSYKNVRTSNHYGKHKR